MSHNLFKIYVHQWRSNEKLFDPLLQSIFVALTLRRHWLKFGSMVSLGTLADGS